MKKFSSLQDLKLYNLNEMENDSVDESVVVRKHFILHLIVLLRIAYCRFYLRNHESHLVKNHLFLNIQIWYWSMYIQIFYFVILNTFE